MTMMMTGIAETIATETAAPFVPVRREAGPIDLVHLARQTFGSAELERDVLHLFVQQGAATVRRIAEAVDATERGPIVHRLKGSAFAVGAVRVGRLAQSLESAATELEIRRLVADLARAVEEVEQFVTSLAAPAT